MIARLTDRFARYRANNGTAGTVWNLFILVLLVLRVVTIGSPLVTVVMAAVLLIGLSLGWVIIPISRVNFRFAARLISIVHWAIIAAIVVSLLGLITVHPLVWIATLGVLAWVMSASFWLVSEPGVLTVTGRKAMEREIERERIRRGEHPDF